MRDALLTRWLRGSFPKFRHLVLSPVKDLFLLPVWCDALLNRRVQWRGHRFLVGRYTRLRLARPPDRPPEGQESPETPHPAWRPLLTNTASLHAG